MLTKETNTTNKNTNKEFFKNSFIEKLSFQRVLSFDLTFPLNNSTNIISIVVLIKGWLSIETGWHGIAYVRLPTYMVLTARTGEYHTQK